VAINGSSLWYLFDEISEKSINSAEAIPKIINESQI
jgi:hypothetical protein